MTQLEDKIRKNPEFLNDSEPSAGHLSRFADRLEQQSASRRIAYWQTSLKIAVTALILISVSYVGFSIFNHQKAQAMAQVTQIKLTGELDEVLKYYDTSSQLKSGEIEKLAANPEEAKRIRKQAGRQLENLDAQLASIEKEYMKNPDNKQLRAAMVNTKRKKSEVIDQIVKQMEMARSGLYSINSKTIQF